MNVAFGGLVLHIADGWMNESTLVFTMPPLAMAASMTLNKLHQAPPAALTITWEEAAGRSPKTLLDERMGQVKKALQRFEETGQGDLGSRHDPIPWIEYSFDAQGPLQQILIIRGVEHRLVCISGRALAPHSPAVRTRFVAAATDLKAG